MGRSKSSRRWLREHFDDPYVKKAQEQGLRSRAAFKLMAIDDRDHILKPGRTVVDLGAAPGGWLQVAARRMSGRGRLIGLDLLPVEPLEGVLFIQGDFRQPEVHAELTAAVAGEGVDLVLSDMAPNISGMEAVDQPRAMYLVELALEFCREQLKPGGDFLVKAFHGEGFDAFLQSLRQDFRQVTVRKPEASRARSREQYLLARGFRGRGAG